MFFQPLLTELPAAFEDVFLTAYDALGHFKRSIVAIELRQHCTILQEAANKLNLPRHAFDLVGALLDFKFLKVYRPFKLGTAFLVLPSLLVYACEVVVAGGLVMVLRAYGGITCELNYP